MSDTLQRPVVDLPTTVLPPIGVADAIRAIAGDLPQVNLAFEPAQSLLWIDLAPEPKPVFTMECIASVAAVQDAVMAYNAGKPSEPVRFLAYRSRGEVFSLGGDLDYYLACLASGDRGGLGGDAARARIFAAGLPGRRCRCAIRVCAGRE